MIPTRLTVSTPLLDMAVEQWGEGDPVLLLHGFPFDPHSFDRAAPLIAAAGMRVLAPYLRGYGPTRFRSAATMRSGQQTAIADDVRALLDALGIERAILAGFDWGARAACIAAALWPDRVRGLLAVGGYLIQDLADPFRPVPPEVEHRLWHQYFLASERGLRALTEQPREVALYLRRQWSLGVDPALFDLSAASFDNPDFAAVAWHSYAHRIGAAPADPRYDALDRALIPAPDIQVPAILLSGGTFIRPERFVRLLDRRVADGAGHDPAAEVPEAFARAVIDLRDSTQK